MPDIETAPQNEQSNKAKSALTPHELVHYHLAHPNEKITDEDIRNLILDSGAVGREHQVKKQEDIPAKEHKNDNSNKDDITDKSSVQVDVTNSEKKIGTPYDVLGGS